MRRILRKIAAGEEDSIGDTSTLADPSVSSQLLSLSLSFYLSISSTPLH
jgi:acetyl-CoA synthetase